MTVVNISFMDAPDQSAINDEQSLLSTTSHSMKHSLFEKYSDELANDEQVQSEIACGKRIGFYRLLKNIGSGNFSQVKLATHIITREKVAVKILDKMKLSSKAQRLLSREISSMERLQHPHIIRLYEVMETMTKLYMVTEYAFGGELYTNITTKGRYKEIEAKLVFSQIISAVEHMHDKHVIHRDIKAENIFITNTHHVKIGDFGFSTLARPDQSLNTFCGSPPYAAPELFKDDYYYGAYVDIWALGILLYFIVTGVTPFRAETVGRLKNLILSGNYSIPSYVSPQCQYVITNILKQNPSERLTLKQIKECEWLEGQIFPRELTYFEINPRLYSTRIRHSQSSGDLNTGPTSTPTGESQLSDDELEVHRQLRALGITEEHVQCSYGRSSRSSVTGVYRIIMHQLHKKRSNNLSAFPLPEVESVPSEKRTARSKMCSML